MHVEVSSYIYIYIWSQRSIDGHIESVLNVSRITLEKTESYSKVRKIEKY